MIGQTISHYRIIEKLGVGGMGIVYKAEDIRLHRFVALKVLPEQVARDPQFVNRFAREAQAASALNHPHICTIHDVGYADDRYFIAMELMEGRTLRDVIADGRLSIEQVLEWGRQIADGLDASHSKGIIHRDLKPGNLFITYRQQAKILDFGLAKILEKPACETGSPQATFLSDITAPGSVFGTIEYMSPEQIRGEPVDTRTDLFSLGVVLYEMTTGERPFTGNTAGVIFDSILHKAPIAPSG